MRRVRPWYWLLERMDMLDDRGKPQFSKLVITVVLIAAISRNTLTTTLAIALICAAYGKSMLLAFLNRTTVTVTDTVTRDMRDAREPSRDDDERGEPDQ